ncbi:MAG TPA: hypothetical protein VGV09_08950 [Steroidobacteraceae bacterium]|nr:hypothetical protein [Steroidobacteraceae bacterium]
MASDSLITAVEMPRDVGLPRTGISQVVRRDRFFLATSIFLLAIVLIGFSRTLFLRPLFQVPAMPWYVYVHGSVMAAWIVLLVVQASLVAAHRTDLHRRLGMLGAMLAVAVLGLSVFLTVEIPANFAVTGGLATTGGPTLPLPDARQIFWGNLAAMTLFPILVAIALWQRRRPEVHKRLLLLASMAMIGPAAGRIAEFPALAGAAPSAPINTWVLALVVVLIVGTPLSLVAHDLLAARRLHRATVAGVLAFFVVTIGARMAAGTAAGAALWTALQ